VLRLGHSIRIAPGARTVHSPPAGGHEVYLPGPRVFSTESEMAPARSIAGSVLVIFGGLLILAVGAVVVSFLHDFTRGFGFSSSFLTGFLYFGPILGLVIIIVGVLALAAPSLNILWGILAIVLGVLSIFSTAIGGVFLGFILALIGGILIIVKRAPPPPVPWMPPTPAPPPP
jgi:hypothetical protein